MRLGSNINKHHFYLCLYPLKPMFPISIGWFVASCLLCITGFCFSGRTKSGKNRRPAELPLSCCQLCSSCFFSFKSEWYDYPRLLKLQLSSCNVIWCLPHNCHFSYYIDASYYSCFKHLDYFPFHIWDVIPPIDELHHFSGWLLHHQPEWPSGNLTVCYWKWPSRNSWFSHWKWWIFP